MNANLDLNVFELCLVGFNDLFLDLIDALEHLESGLNHPMTLIHLYLVSSLIFLDALGVPHDEVSVPYRLDFVNFVVHCHLVESGEQLLNKLDSFFLELGEDWDLHGQNGHVFELVHNPLLRDQGLELVVRYK